jgi:ketosteroid isomerase-like protein
MLSTCPISRNQRLGSDNVRFYTVPRRRSELVAAGVSGDLAYTVGYERSTGSVNGRPVRTLMLRATQIYRREDGEWKIVHRHADYPPADEGASG